MLNEDPRTARPLTTLSHGPRDYPQRSARHVHDRRSPHPGDDLFPLAGQLLLEAFVRDQHDQEVAVPRRFGETGGWVFPGQRVAQAHVVAVLLEDLEDLDGG